MLGYWDGRVTGDLLIIADKLLQTLIPHHLSGIDRIARGFLNKLCMNDRKVYVTFFLCRGL
jgi:hypothetical protein